MEGAVWGPGGRGVVGGRWAEEGGRERAAHFLPSFLYGSAVCEREQASGSERIRESNGTELRGRDRRARSFRGGMEARLCSTWGRWGGMSSIRGPSERSVTSERVEHLRHNTQWTSCWVAVTFPLLQHSIACVCARVCVRERESRREDWSFSVEETPHIPLPPSPSTSSFPTLARTRRVGVGGQSDTSITPLLQLRETTTGNICSQLLFRALY